MTKKDKNKTSYSKDLRKEKPFFEKLKLIIIKDKLNVILLFTLPIILFWLIMAIISQKLEVFAFQSVCCLFFFISLHDFYNPPKESIGGVPYIFGACLCAFTALFLTQFYF